MFGELDQKFKTLQACLQTWEDGSCDKILQGSCHSHQFAAFLIWWSLCTHPKKKTHEHVPRDAGEMFARSTDISVAFCITIGHFVE